MGFSKSDNYNYFPPDFGKTGLGLNFRGSMVFTENTKPNLYLCPFWFYRLEFVTRRAPFARGASVLPLPRRLRFQRTVRTGRTARRVQSREQVQAKKTHVNYELSRPCSFRDTD